MNKGIVLDGILSCIKEGIEKRERNAIFAIRNGNWQLFFFPFVCIWENDLMFENHFDDLKSIDYLIEKL